MLSRAKPALQQANQPTKSADTSNKADQFEDYLHKRDYTGAITLLEV